MERIVSLLTSRLVLRTGLSLASILAFVGCSPSAKSDRAPASASSSVRPGASAEDLPGSLSPRSAIDNPELLLRPPPAQEAALLAAVDDALRLCMVDEGFEYNSPDVGDYLQGVLLRVALGGEEFPRGDARRVDDPPSMPDEDDPNRIYLENLSESARTLWNEALSGTGASVLVETAIGSIGFPQDGCRAEGFASVYRGNAAETRSILASIANLESVAHSVALSSSEVAAAQSSWVECMKVNGYSFASFSEATVAARVSDAQTGDSEVLVRADTDCSTSAGLDSVYRSAFNAEIDRLLNQYSEQIVSVLEIQQAAIERLGIEGQ